MHSPARLALFVVSLLAAGQAQAAITRVECADGATGRSWCRADSFGACQNGTARMNVWVDESGYYQLKSTLYTNDSGDEQLNEAFYLLVTNSQNPGGEPIDPNCDGVFVVEDGRQDQVGPLGTFYLVAGEANRVELIHYCILYRSGRCTQYFEAGGEGGGGCANCESVGLNFSGVAEHTVKVPPPCASEGVIVGDEICDGVDNDCDGEVDEGLTNACGGCGALPGEPGAACDECGQYICAEDGTLSCQIANPNACGGCAVLQGEPGDACGDCGELVCDDDGTLSCQSLQANACGGCFSAEGSPGEACGDCGEYVCGERGEVVCFDPGFNACGACGLAPPEVCDGDDNDCDGFVDEALGDEVCNCLDDDCDGEIDEGALCGAGRVCSGCRCATPCQEQQCGAGFVCQNDLCVPEPCPNAPCPAGQSCQQGQCVDPCAEVSCPAGSACRDGACVDESCHSQGCPADLICRNGDCVVDLCAEVSCEAAQFCRDGACVASCAGVDCPRGQRCHDGECADDPCATVRCGEGFVCHAGACIQDPCAAITCPGALRCHDAVCVGDPCEGIVCPAGQSCRDDGQCDQDEGEAPLHAQDCGCRETPGSAASAWLLLLALGWLCRRAARVPSGV